MKLTTLFIILALITVQANESYGQRTKITLDYTDIRVDQLIDRIENTTEFRFVFKMNAVELDRFVSINVQDGTIDEALDRVFDGTKTDYKVRNRRIYLTKKLGNDKETVQKEQNVDVTIQSSITGVVTDEKGVPLPGASIVEKGTTNGTQTDFDGNFTLDVTNENAVLIVSYIGFATKEIPIEGQTDLQISLSPDTANLDEVVVLGYGAQSKRKVTSAVSTLQGKELVKAPAPNLAAALTGKISGVITTQPSGQPGFDNVQFLIRGVTSFSGSQNPLVIVDGIERPFSRINPNNVASISILKDASATAVYGRRGANGVVLVTTKRGAMGKPTFEYNGRYGWQSQTRKVEVMNAAEYSRYLNEAKANIGEDPVFTDQQVADYENGVLPSYDWVDALLENGAPQQQHNISASGGTERTKYFVSYGFLDQEGLFETVGFDQHSLRSNLDMQFGKRLKAGLDVLGRLENRQGPPFAGNLDTDLLARLENRIDENTQGDIYSGAVFGHPTLNPFPDVPGVPNAIGFNGFNGSPIGAANRSGFSERNRAVFQSNINFEYDIPGIDGLKAKALYSYDLTKDKSVSFATPFSWYELNPNTNEYSEVRSATNDNIVLRESSFDFERKTLQLSLDYNRTFGDHTIGALALFERIENEGSLLYADRRGFISTSTPLLFAGNIENDNNTSVGFQSAARGVVGRFNYDYKSKYLFSATMRIDESFAFGPEFRTGYFPAFSAGWILSEESFLADSNLINFLKLRGSWGQVGNDNVPQFQYLSAYSFDGGAVINGAFNGGIRSDGIPNPSITWETITSSDVGLEANLLNNKIGVELEYFRRKTTDILDTPTGSVPATFGAEIADRPLGEFDSWGFEAVLKHTNQVGDLFYSIDGNVTWFDNEVVKFNEPADINPAIAQVGRRLFSENEGVERIGFIADGLFQSQEEIDNHATQFGTVAPGDIKYRDINGRDENGNLTGQPDGVIDADDRVVIGVSDTPNFVYGFNINAEYKGFDLQANFQGAANYTRDIRPFPFERDGNALKILIDSWRPGNEDARYPRLTAGDLTPNNDQASTFWITKVRYLRLRNLEIGYNFPTISDKLEELGIGNFRVFFSGNNLFTWTNLDWRDPEGEEVNLPFYPQVKTISFGLNVQF